MRRGARLSFQLRAAARCVATLDCRRGCEAAAACPLRRIDGASLTAMLARDAELRARSIPLKVSGARGAKRALSEVIRSPPFEILTPAAGKGRKVDGHEVRYAPPYGSRPFATGSGHPLGGDMVALTARSPFRQRRGRDVAHGCGFACAVNFSRIHWVASPQWSPPS